MTFEGILIGVLIWFIVGGIIANTFIRNVVIVSENGAHPPVWVKLCITVSLIMSAPILMVNSVLKR